MWRRRQVCQNALHSIVGGVRIDSSQAGKLTAVLVAAVSKPAWEIVVDILLSPVSTKPLWVFGCHRDRQSW